MGDGEGWGMEQEGMAVERELHRSKGWWRRKG